MHQTYGDALNNSLFIRAIPHQNSLSPSVANTQYTEEFMALLKQKFSLKVFYIFFIKILKLALHGVMKPLKEERKKNY